MCIKLSFLNSWAIFNQLFDKIRVFIINKIDFRLPIIDNYGSNSNY